MQEQLKTLLQSLDLTKLKAELYRKSFYEFSLEAFKTLHNGQELTPNWHIKLLCDRLQVEAERIVNGGERTKHLLINVPPRTLKLSLIHI